MERDAGDDPTAATPELTRVCPACGATLGERARFCSGCGAACPPATGSRGQPWRVWLGVATMLLIGFVCIALYARLFSGESGVRGDKWFDMPLYPGAQIGPMPFQGEAYAVASFTTEDSAAQVMAWHRSAVSAAGMVPAQGIPAPQVFGQTMEFYAFGDYIYGFTAVPKGTYTVVGLMRIDPTP